MKKIYIILGIIIVLTSTILFTEVENNKVKYVDYNGFKLAMSVDGESVTSLPSGNYYLVRYECSNGTILSWDSATSTLVSENNNIKDACHLEFESSPELYDIVNIGDYISYVGDGATHGCSANECKGWNYGQKNNNPYESYGYCNDSSHKYYNYGWRVLYKNDNSVYIVSAGSPECLLGTVDDSEGTKKILNDAALKYCNNEYLSGGVCTKDTAHAFNGDDFYKFTTQYYGSGNARYLSSYDDGGTHDETGTKICYGKYSTILCGYSNDLIDNGSYYWFASANSQTHTLFWSSSGGAFINQQNSGGTKYGMRPVLKLDKTIQTTGGIGTKENPYTISARTSQ